MKIVVFDMDGVLVDPSKSFRQGTLDLEQWQTFLHDMEAESRQEKLWSIWGDWSYVFDEPFLALMDSLRAANFD